jgi:FMN-dependent NADH-azoreductase
MKTLIVKYIPRYERSVTNKLLNEFIKSADTTELEILDLCESTPDFFNPENIEAYYLRNMMGKELSAAQADSLLKMQIMTQQLKSADIVIIAFPMFNFSMPGAIKAWFDSVLHVGETIDPRGGVYKGLMSGKKALILIAAGGIYSYGDGIGPYFGPEWEYAMSLAKLELKFMGYSEILGVMAEGTAVLNEEAKTEMLNQKLKEVKKIAEAWYK